MKTRIALSLLDLPGVPADTAQVTEQAAATTRRMPDSMSDALRGLDEVASRGKNFPGELGDLGPELAGKHAAEIQRGEAITEGIVRAKALKAAKKTG